MKHIRLLSALLAVVMLVIAAAGCGGSTTSTIASVDGADIDKSELERWMAITAKASKLPATLGTLKPDIATCVTQTRKTATAGAGQAKPSSEALTDQCKQQAKLVRESTVTQLIQNEWIAREAAAQDVTVSDAEVRKAFQAQKKQSFNTDAKYRQFLKDNGMSERDVLARVRTTELAGKLQKKFVKADTDVSSKEIADFYAKNRRQFAVPSRRDVQIIMTKTNAKAKDAVAAIDGGQRFASVAKKFSVDQATAKNGGVVKGIAKDQQEPTLDKAIFSAGLGELVGPVKTDFGFFVLRVTKTYKPSQKTLKQASAQIRQQLLTERNQKAIAAYSEKFTSRWKKLTECEKGYVVELCKGYKAPTQTTQTTGQPAAPQGAPADPAR